VPHATNEILDFISITEHRPESAAKASCAGHAPKYDGDLNRCVHHSRMAMCERASSFSARLVMELFTMISRNPCKSFFRNPHATENLFMKCGGALLAHVALVPFLLLVRTNAKKGRPVCLAGGAWVPRDETKNIAVLAQRIFRALGSVECSPAMPLSGLVTCTFFFSLLYRAEFRRACIERMVLISSSTGLTCSLI